MPEGADMLDANLADRKVVQYVMNRFGIHAKHRLGQNFLIRPDVVAAIAELLNLVMGRLSWRSGPVSAH